MRVTFEKLCLQLILLLSALLILLLGIRTAGAMIRYGRAQGVEIINNLVEQLQSDPANRLPTKKTRDTLLLFAQAYLGALVRFEFLPRAEDLTILAQLLDSVPEGTQVLSFSYYGRDLTVRTVQSSPVQMLEMAKRLESSEYFSDVVYSYYLDAQGQCVAEISLLSPRYQTELPTLSWLAGAGPPALPPFLPKKM